MKHRCLNPANPNWKNYGGRGIRVCDEWLASFDAFYAYVGDPPEGMSLDRIDNDGNYEPGNVRWATMEQQLANRRPRQPQTGPRPRRIPGESPLIAIGAAARLLAVSIGTVRNWDRRGKITSIRTPSGQRRFYRTDVDALMNRESAA